MTLSLYELTTEYTQALDFLTDPDNDINATTIADTIESLDDTLDKKCLNVGRFIATLEAEAEAIEDVELRLRNRRQALENKAGWLRDYLCASMQATGHNALKAPDIAIKLAKLPPSVQIHNEAIIPAQYWTEKTIRTIDKLAIREAGGCIGTSIESNGVRVSIK